MTTVNDFVDILRIIREQPEWGDALRSALLSKEVLELPQRLAEFAETTNKRFDKLEEDVGVLKSDVGVLKSDVSGLKEGQARLESAVSRLEGQVGNIRGDSYERKIGDIISSIMSERMSILVRVLKGGNVVDDSEIFDLLYDAEGRGIISRQERDEVSHADMILRERRPRDATALYMVVEVSTTVAGYDISRAYERAAIMQRISGETAIPVVIGAHVDGAREQLARERNVTLITVGE